MAGQTSQNGEESQEPHEIEDTILDVKRRIKKKNCFFKANETAYFKQSGEDRDKERQGEFIHWSEKWRRTGKEASEESGR